MGTIWLEIGVGTSALCIKEENVASEVGPLVSWVPLEVRKTKMSKRSEYMVVVCLTYNGIFRNLAE